MKTPVIQSDDYTVYLEYSFDLSFIHCDCYRWNKTVKAALLADFNKLIQIHRKPIFAIHEIGDKKHYKFIEMFGFTFQNEIKGLDNIMRHLYTRGS
tara:strand:- start:176 stop:463 length:288 start_codon:yes stop_codon:yes gene_type:complete